MKKKKYNFRLDVLIIVTLIVVVLSLAFFQALKLQNRDSFNQDIEQFVDFVKQARQKALVGEKISGEAPFAYGVYFIEDKFEMCADFDGDLLCSDNERLDIKFEFSDNYKIENFKIINFIKFHSIDSVCVAENCDGQGEELFVTFVEENMKLSSDLYIDLNNGNIMIK